MSGSGGAIEFFLLSNRGYSVFVKHPRGTSSPAQLRR